jgi:hypothetical protein
MTRVRTRHSDIWSAAACHSGDMGFELCYLPDMPAVLRALAGAENSIKRWWQQLEAAKKHPEGSGKVINALAMAPRARPPAICHTAPVLWREGNMMFAFNGRATRNFLGLLVVMHFILFVDRVNLAAAGG